MAQECLLGALNCVGILTNAVDSDKYHSCLSLETHKQNM